MKSEGNFIIGANKLIEKLDETAKNIWNFEEFEKKTDRKTYRTYGKSDKT